VRAADIRRQGRLRRIDVHVSRWVRSASRRGQVSWRSICWRAEALGLGHLLDEVGQCGQGEGGEQDVPESLMALSRVRNEMVTAKLAAQFAIVATLIAVPRIWRIVSS
jgi:hypothetical protein